MAASYQQTLDYLFSRLPMFSRLGKAAIKKDLTNTLALCAALGHPEKKFKSIHIAGTNGKGSTSHALAAIFQEAGYTTGLYTSPHLVDFRERIRINGVPVDEPWVIDFVAENKSLIEAVLPSFFEITVAMAFAAFAEKQVDIAIIETGLGGRLDSTNVLKPELSIITNISLDHTDLLGHTRAEIAGEKAGIIKPGVPALIGSDDAETFPVFFQKALAEQSPVYVAGNFWELVNTGQKSDLQYFKAVDLQEQKIYPLATDLAGSYQKENLQTVLAAVTLLQHQGWQLPLETALPALGRVKAQTGLRGRWEVLQQSPFIVADVAHNEAGISAVLSQWQEVPKERARIVMGFVRDKDLEKVLSLMPAAAIYYFTAAQVPRALPAGELAEMAHKKGLQGKAYATVAEAVQAATNAMSAGDALLITGSFFIVGEALTATGSSAML